MKLPISDEKRSGAESMTMKKSVQKGVINKHFDEYLFVE
jgi:hypothetical protein